MVTNNGNLCPKETYCKYGAYCERVDPKIRAELMKTSSVSAIDVEIFVANGSGMKCCGTVTK